MVCSAASGAAFGVIGTASRAKKTKRDVQLDHLHAPIFVYIEKERFIPRSPQAPDTALRPRRRNI